MDPDPEADCFGVTIPTPLCSSLLCEVGLWLRRPGINDDKESVRNIEMIFTYTRWQKPLRFDSTNKPIKVEMRKIEGKGQGKSMAFDVICLQDKVTYLMQPPSSYRSARFPFSTMLPSSALSVSKTWPLSSPQNRANPFNLEFCLCPFSWLRTYQTGKKRRQM